MKPLTLLTLMVGSVLTSAVSYGAIIVSADVDFNIDNPTNFVGFENLGTYEPGTELFVGNLTYEEDNVLIEQVDGDDDASSIWASYFSPEGDLGWYPNGGDYGYTKITLGDGSDFDAIKFHRTSGGGASHLYYQLRKDDSVVLEGSVSHQKYLTGSQPRVFTPASLHFYGGGFDEIWLRDGGANASFGDNNLNTLAIDAIEIRSANGASAAPEPSSLVMWGLATGGMAFGAYRRRRREQTVGAQ